MENSNNMIKFLALNFATHLFSTLKKIPDDVVSHKNSRYQKVCLYWDILAKISAHHLQLKCIWESVLSDSVSTIVE